MENIVICGSMKVKEKILSIGKELENMGYNVLYPNECFMELPKEIASRAHFERIIDMNNKKVLIVNEEKNGIKNYIGPNSFAEVAFAFYFNKQIYLLNDIYPPYEDELRGWKVHTLKGDLEEIRG